MTEVGTGREGQEGFMSCGQELPSVLVSRFIVVLVETSPTIPQREGGCEMV